MNAPTPPPSNGKILQPLERSSKAALIAGPVLAGGSVWFVREFVLPPGSPPLDEVATAFIGALGTVILGELWLVYTRLRDKLLNGG